MSHPLLLGDASKGCVTSQILPDALPSIKNQLGRTGFTCACHTNPHAMPKFLFFGALFVQAATFPQILSIALT
jgi:hypothetical protein